jgi:hypothetical protein
MYGLVLFRIEKPEEPILIALDDEEKVARSRTNIVHLDDGKIIECLIPTQFSIYNYSSRRT